MNCHCDEKNRFKAGWVMRYGSIVPTKENKLVKKMLDQDLQKTESKFDGELREHYLCRKCGAQWELTYDETTGGAGRGVKILTKLTGRK